MVDSVNTSSQRVNPQVDGQDQAEKHIHEKHKHQHNHLGAHHHASEKERLKKLLEQIEKMLASHQGEDDRKSADAKGNNNDIQKLIQDHVKNSVRNLRDKYGINDENLNHIHNLKEADNALATQGDIVLSGGIAVLYLFMNLLSDLAQYKYLEMQQKAKVSRDAQNMANEVQEIIADISKGKDPDTAKKPLPDSVIKYMEQNDVKIDGKSIDDYLKSTKTDKSDTDNSTDNKTYKFHSKNLEYNITIEKSSNGYWYVTNANNYDKSWNVPTPQKVNPDFKNGKVEIDISKLKSTSKKGNNPNTGKPWMGAPSKGTILTANDGSSDSTSSKPQIDPKKYPLDKGQLDAVKSALENTSNRASDYVSQSQLQLQKIMQTYNVTVSLINSMQTMLEEMNKSIAQNIR
ncbi:hypothetical protein JQC92_01855 [Shewanella sp. 202IG2-18]|nr:hypothetical protein [Parashewanella hymeniacidonis]MBM7070787.1 hypothetical protein [Parashewanella hymeniacidonis]